MRNFVKPLIFALLTYEATATVSQKQTLSQITSKSDCIVVGQINRLHTVVDRGEVWTIVTVTPEKVVKGPAANILFFRIPGGTYTRHGQTFRTEYEGIPPWQVLDRGVFFLEGSAPQYPNVVGFNQGIRKIYLDGGQQFVTSAEPSSDSEPLQQFLDRIYNVLKEGKK